jgi:hypothetical protein
LGIPIKVRFSSAYFEFSSCGNNCCLVKGVIAIDIDKVIIKGKIKKIKKNLKGINIRKEQFTVSQLVFPF